MIDKNYFFEKIQTAIQGALVSSVIIGGVASAQAMQEQQQDKMTSLPTCIVGELCTYLSPKDICALSQVNKHFNSIMQNDRVSKVYKNKFIELARNHFFNDFVENINIGRRFDMKILSCFNDWFQQGTREREKCLLFFYKKGLFQEIMDLAIFPKWSILKENYPWPPLYIQDPQTKHCKVKDTNNSAFVSLYCYEMAAFCCKFDQLEELKLVLKRKDFLKYRETQPRDCYFEGVFTAGYSYLTNGTLLTIAKQNKSDKIISYFEELDVKEEVNFPKQPISRKRRIDFNSPKSEENNDSFIPLSPPDLDLSPNNEPDLDLSPNNEYDKENRIAKFQTSRMDREETLDLLKALEDSNIDFNF